MPRIINGFEVEEYDGYSLPERRELTDEERKELESKIHELRNKVRKANGFPEKSRDEDKIVW